MTDATLPAGEDLAGTADNALSARRWFFFGLNALSMIVLGSMMTHAMAARGWSAASGLFLVLFVVGLPWTLIGFWNAAIGFLIMRFSADPVALTNPALRITPKDSPIATRTAVCLAVRHEDVTQVFARLDAMIRDVARTPWADQFDFHVLSDSARPEIAVAEEEAFDTLKDGHPRAAFLHYRRRAVNTGFKAGNLMEFARRAQGRYDHVIVLDADSVMSAASMLRLVRAMQANPTLGILQTLVVGQPSGSAFTRIFQFGMRHAMRTQTVGSAWWQGPAGPFWGHNAILRLQPFVDHCALPLLSGTGPLGGQVLSHDQVEAAMMRGAGYDVRVIADEFESWEENPPNLPDFIKRDLRWCQGNLQYLKLLAMPGLRPMGRFQLVNAIMMYAGAPAGLIMLLTGLAMIDDGSKSSVPASVGFALYFIMLALGFAPRLLGLLDVLLRSDQRRRYGGLVRLLVGGFIDMLFSFFLGPLMMIAQSVFIAGLIFGRRVLWEAQNRDGRAVPVGEALRGLWPQMLFGLAFAGVLVAYAPGVLLVAAPTILPCLLAVPFTSLSAGRVLGRLFVRFRVCAIPDEYAPPPTVIISKAG
ncbi:MAG TPA: glucans biosynthesis glucosyltransferase MdoH [Alphaproteobacteria bacterium]|jgi:membrane glycosyltransferase|nr:glucans biosynthesis glucosyltransferase MdoH [Alphaproteobacteria bacterium]